MGNPCFCNPFRLRGPYIVQLDQKEGVMKRMIALVVVVLLLGMVPLVSSAQRLVLGTGISCEPVDIGGGGFFLDVIGNIVLLDTFATFHLRPVFSIGPLPLRVSRLILDGIVVVEFPLEDFTLFAGAGMGAVFTEHWRHLHTSWVTIVGATVALDESLSLFVQVRTRGIGFFVSPGVGVEMSF